MNPPRKLDERELEAGAELLRAFGHPLRLAIVLSIHEHGTRCVHELVEELGAAQPLVSQHLRTLRGASVLSGERRGKEIAYSLVDHHVIHIALDAIEHANEATPHGPNPKGISA